MTEIQLKTLIKACAQSLNESLWGFKKKELDDILNLQYIHGVSTLDELESSKKHRLEVYNFIFRKMRWLLSLEYPINSRPEWSAPFSHFFKSEGETYENWMRDFHDAVREELNQFLHWQNFDLNKLKGTNDHRRINYKLAEDLSKRYPSFERDLRTLDEYLHTFNFKSVQSPLNPENYPLFVSLYTSNREYGGPEEGGWYYTHMEHVASIKVNNYKEARVAAVKLLRNMPSTAFSGTKILLEKTEKCLQMRERPHYS